MNGPEPFASSSSSVLMPHVMDMVSARFSGVNDVAKCACCSVTFNLFSQSTFGSFQRAYVCHGYRHVREVKVYSIARNLIHYYDTLLCIVYLYSMYTA